jgi:hypothetical protein
LVPLPDLSIRLTTVSQSAIALEQFRRACLRAIIRAMPWQSAHLLGRRVRERKALQSVLPLVVLIRVLRLLLSEVPLVF